MMMIGLMPRMRPVGWRRVLFRRGFWGMKTESLVVQSEWLGEKGDCFTLGGLKKRSEPRMGFGGMKTESLVVQSQWLGEK